MRDVRRWLCHGVDQPFQAGDCIGLEVTRKAAAVWIGGACWLSYKN